MRRGWTLAGLAFGKTAGALLPVQRVTQTTGQRCGYCALAIAERAIGSVSSEVHL